MHLLMDGPCKNTDVMRDRELLAQWLHETALQADMTPHGEPLIGGFTWPGSGEQEALSGVQLLNESSITMLTYVSAHTWPEVGYAFVDIFSCRDFDQAGMEKHVKKTLGMMPAKVLPLERGVNPVTGVIVSARVRRR